MSFAVWNQKPPFDEETLNPGEKIYQVGDQWVVTDDPTRATQAEVDAVLAPPPEATPAEKLAKAGLTTQDLRDLLGL